VKEKLELREPAESLSSSPNDPPGETCHPQSNYVNRAAGSPSLQEDCQVVLSAWSPVLSP
jgi:hypothetical protein